MKQYLRSAAMAAMMAGALAPAARAQVAATPQIMAALAEMGNRFDRETIGRTFGLYKPLHGAIPAGVTVTADQAYGSDPRHRLDVYAPAGADGTQPIVTFAHGGGFVRGDKAEVAHLGGWLAAHGVVAVVWNYRLAPEAVWPSGIEDQSAVIDWIAAHPEIHHGDPSKVVAAGNSAGSMHVAGYLWNRLGRAPAPGVIGAILISPPTLNLTDHPIDPARDALYLGTDPAALEARSPIKALGAANVPVMLAWGEYDLPLVMDQTAQLIAALSARDGRLPAAASAPGHNHISIIEHFGTADETLGPDLIAFVRRLAGR